MTLATEITLRVTQAAEGDPETLETRVWARLRERTTRSGKHCTGCRTIRPLFMFGLNRYGEDGLSRECHVCHHQA